MRFWKILGLTSTTLMVVIYGCGGEPARSPAGAQPNMEAARSELRAARAALERAEHNKGGHRVRAIELTDQAIVEVDKGIAYAD